MDKNEVIIASSGPADVFEFKKRNLVVETERKQKARWLMLMS